MGAVQPCQNGVGMCVGAGHQRVLPALRMGVGRPLAMAEATAALTSLFDRFPRLALADPARPPKRLRSIISTGHQELPVLLHGRDPGPQPGPRPEEAGAIRKLTELGGTSGTTVPRG